MAKDRLEKVLAYINQNKTVTLSELENTFGVSSATIRRDITSLAESGKIKRLNGVVKSVLNEQKDEPPYKVRINLELDEKKRIAKKAYEMIEDGDSIFLDSSTTVLELAKLLADSNKDITVITNDMQIAYILAPHPIIELIVVGGTIRKGYYTSIGFIAENLWKELYADQLFLGVDAVSLELGMMNYRIEELPCKKIMIANSKYRTVLCDHTKFNSSAVLKVCNFEDINQIITGKEIEQYKIKSEIEKQTKVCVVE